MEKQIIDFERKPHTRFEISLVVRDLDGNPTNKRKSIKTSSSDEIWDFFMRNNGKPKRKKAQDNIVKKKKRKRIKENLPTAKQADDILKKFYKNGEED